MGRDAQYPLTTEKNDNMADLLTKINGLLAELGVHPTVSSGYRPDAINMQVAGAAKMSAHRTCQAVDLHDEDGSLAQLLKDRLDLRMKYGLRLENPRFTRGWVHLQTRPLHDPNQWTFDP